ncbi:MAG: NAD-dependent epimerase/dehydratase family protein [Bacteroidota bacterium]
MKTILVTGATGFLGRHLVGKLSQDGSRIRCIVRHPDKARNLLQRNIELVIGDLSNQEVAFNAVQGVDAIVHAAGQVGGWGNKEAYMRNNVVATRNLLEACASHGVKRFLFVSSVASYGLQPGRLLTEESPAEFISDPYCQTKLECENLVRHFSDRHRITATVLRPSIIFGPFDRRFLRRVVEAVRSGTVVTVGKRNQGPPLVYVEDVVNFTAAILRSQSTPFEIYNLSSPEDVSWERIVHEVSIQLRLRTRLVRIPFRLAYAAGSVLEFMWKLVRASRPPLVTRFRAALLGLSYQFDSSKALSVPGFPGFTPFSTALDASIRWIQQEEQLAATANRESQVRTSTSSD